MEDCVMVMTIPPLNELFYLTNATRNAQLALLYGNSCRSFEVQSVVLVENVQRYYLVTSEVS